MATKKFFTLSNGREVYDVVAFDDANVLSDDQKAGIDGASSSVTGSNPVIEESDSRLTDTRTPTSHDNTYHSATYIEASGVTYENLNSNGDVGAAASTVAAGDDGRFLTTDEKAAAAAEGTPSVTNKYVTKDHLTSVVNNLDPQNSITHGIDYVKAGTPIGAAATNGEKCLDTTNDKLHIFTGGAWDAGAACSAGDRFCHADTGTDISDDSGTHTKSDKIYNYDTTTTFTEIVPNEGYFAWFEDEDKNRRYNSTDWVGETTTQQHNNLGGKQGGTSDEFYHITSNQEAGMDAATAITAANPPQTKADRDQLPVPYKFSYKGGFAVSQTDTIVYEANGVFSGILMPSAGSIVKETLQSTGARTVGSLTCAPTIDGTKVTETALNGILDAGTTNDDKAEIAPATTNLTFTAGQKLGSKWTSSVDWAPVDSDVEYTIYVVFDS